MAEHADSEIERVHRQVMLDSQRSSLERNKAGQFATPSVLAGDIVRHALAVHGGRPIRFLEPSCGSGAFISALLRQATGEQVEAVTGVELDPRFAVLASQLWGQNGSIVEADFISWAKVTHTRASLVVANPPYVRHHHLDAAQKLAYAKAVAAEVGIQVSQLAGLYVYFLLLTHKLLEPDAVSAWLIPTEFMDVNYGAALREYLTTQVELIRIHRFDAADAQFNDALVSSAVVVFRNRKPSEESIAAFTHGGSMDAPRDTHYVEHRQLKSKEKWIRHFQGRGPSDPPAEVLGHFFEIRRGIATGSNAIFIRQREELQRLGISSANYRPILPSPRNLAGLEVTADDEGWPTNVSQLGLIDTMESMESLVASDPALADYLTAQDRGAENGYLSRQRRPWYRQEQRPAPPFLCTYMGRGASLDQQPVRFILNRSQATATNGFLLLYPKGALAAFLFNHPDSIDRVHSALNQFSPEELRNAGRAYGGGLHKVEPSELASLDASSIRKVITEESRYDDVTDLVEQALNLGL